MLKLIPFALLTLFMSLARAQSTQPHHLVSIDTDGFGWSGLNNLFDWDKSKSGNVSDQESDIGKLHLNYSYILENRLMVGFALAYEKETIETKFGNGTKKTDDTLTSTFAVSVGHNFNEDIFNSWWMKAFLGAGQVKSETEDTSATPSKTKTDLGVSFVTLEFGKRFNLATWGLKNISYSPSLAVTSVTYSKDAKDIGLGRSGSAQLNLIKFDILF